MVICEQWYSGQWGHKPTWLCLQSVTRVPQRHRFFHKKLSFFAIWDLLICFCNFWHMFYSSHLAIPVDPIHKDSCDHFKREKVMNILNICSWRHGPQNGIDRDYWLKFIDKHFWDFSCMKIAGGVIFKMGVYPLEDVSREFLLCCKNLRELDTAHC